MLRAFTETDIAGRADCGNDAEIHRMFGASSSTFPTSTMTREEAAAWYAGVASDDNPLHWAIEYEGRFIGTARLHSVNEIDRRARFAIGILDRNVLGIGLGTEVTQEVLDYGFRTVGLHRIDLRVLAYNDRAIRCYHRAGFIEEGRERDAALVDGRWYDDVIMSLLSHDWQRPH